MKSKSVEIKENKKVKLTYNNITENGLILSMTRDGFWFKGDTIDKFIHFNEVNPDLEYVIGNKIEEFSDDIN